MVKNSQSVAEPVVLSLPELSEGFADLTGEVTRIPRLEVPQISVSYKDADEAGDGEVKGEFVEVGYVDGVGKVRKGLGKSITIQILHHRQSLNAYAETEQWFTPEVSMKAKELSLFMVSTGATGKKSIRFMARGEQKALREQFQNLSYRRILYVLHEGVLKSLVVKGASFGKFIDLTKALHGNSSSSVLLNLTTEKGKKGTVTYYSIVFTPGDKVDMDIAKPTLQQLSDWFGKYDALMDAQQKDKADQAAIERGDGPIVTAVATPTTPYDIAEEIFDEPKKPITDKDLENAGL